MSEVTTLGGGIRTSVTPDEAIKFCENALRNFNNPRLSVDELCDIAGALELFIKDRVEASPLAQSAADLFLAAQDVKAIRPENWDDDEDPDHHAAWLALDAAISSATGAA